MIVGERSAAALAAKAATTTIPIVFTYGDDPVKEGLVASLNRPGGNVTGVTFIDGGWGKATGAAARAGAQGDHQSPCCKSDTILKAEAERRDVQTAARAIGCKLVVLEGGSDREIETAFAAFVQRGGRLLVGTGPFLLSDRRTHRCAGGSPCVPAIYLFASSPRPAA